MILAMTMVVGMTPTAVQAAPGEGAEQVVAEAAASEGQNDDGTGQPSETGNQPAQDGGQSDTTEETVPAEDVDLTEDTDAPADSENAGNQNDSPEQGTADDGSNDGTAAEDTEAAVGENQDEGADDTAVSSPMADAAETQAKPVYEIDIEAFETQAEYTGYSVFELGNITLVKTENGVTTSESAMDAGVTAVWKVQGTDAAVAGEPVNAGKYELTLTYPKAEGTHDGAEKKVECEITKAPVEFRFESERVYVKPGTAAKDVKPGALNRVYCAGNNLDAEDFDLKATAVKNAMTGEEIPAEEKLLHGGDYALQITPSIKADAAQAKKDISANYDLAPFIVDIETGELVDTYIEITLAEKWKENGIVTLKSYDGKAATEPKTPDDYTAVVKYWDEAANDITGEVKKKQIWGTSYDDSNMSQVYEPLLTLEVKDGTGFKAVLDADYELEGGKEYRIVFDGQKAIYNADGTFGHRTSINEDRNINGYDYNYETDDTRTADAQARAVEVTAATRAVIDVSELVKDDNAATLDQIATLKSKVYDGREIYSARSQYKNKVGLKTADDKGTKIKTLAKEFSYEWQRNDAAENLQDKENLENEDNWSPVYGFTISPDRAGIYRLKITYQDMTEDGTLYYADNSEYVYYAIDRQKVKIVPNKEKSYETLSGRSVGSFFDDNEIDCSILDAETEKALTFPKGHYAEVTWQMQETVGEKINTYLQYDYGYTFVSDAGTAYAIQAAGLEVHTLDNDGYEDFSDNYTVASADTVPLTVKPMGTVPVKLEVDASKWGSKTKVYDGKPFAQNELITDGVVTAKKVENGAETTIEDPGISYITYDPNEGETRSLDWTTDAGVYELYACFDGSTAYAPIENPDSFMMNGVKIGIFEITQREITLKIDNMPKTYEAGILVSDILRDIPGKVRVEGFVPGQEWAFTEDDGIPAWDHASPVFEIYEKGSKTPVDEYTSLKWDQSFVVRYAFWSDGLSEGYYTEEFGEINFRRNYKVSADVAAAFDTVKGNSHIESVSYEGISEIAVVSKMDEKDPMRQEVTVLDGIGYSRGEFYDGYDDIIMEGNLAAFDIAPPAYYGDSVPETAMFRNEIKQQKGIAEIYDDKIRVVFNAAEGTKTFRIRWEDDYVETYVLKFDEAVKLGNLEEAVAPKSLAFNAVEKKMAVGESQQLDVKITKAQMGDIIKLGYKSSDESVLKVNENGYVTALKEGKANIEVFPVRLVKGKLERIKDAKGVDAKGATVAVAVTKLSAPKPVKVTSHGSYADVNYDIPKDGYRREIYVVDNGKNPDLLTYKFGGTKLTYYPSGSVDLDAVQSAITSQKQESFFKVNENGYLTAVKAGGALTLALTDKNVAKIDKDKATATVKVTSADLEPVKSLKAYDVIDDSFGLTFTHTGGAERFLVEISDNNRLIYSRGYIASEHRMQTEDGEIVKDAYRIRPEEIIARLNRESAYTVSVKAQYNTVASKAVSAKVKTTKIPAVSTYIGDDEYIDTDPKIPRRGGMEIQVSEDDSGTVLCDYNTALQVLSGNAYTLTVKVDSNRGRVSDTLVWTLGDAKVANVKAAAGTYCVTLKGLKPGSTVLEVKSKIWGNKVIARYDIHVVAVGNAYDYYGDNEKPGYGEPSIDNGGSSAPAYLPLGVDDRRKVTVGQTAYFHFQAPETGRYRFSGTGNVFGGIILGKGEEYDKPSPSQSSSLDLGLMKAGERICLSSRANEWPYRPGDVSYYVEVTMTQSEAEIVEKVSAVGDTTVTNYEGEKIFEFTAPESADYEFSFMNTRYGNWEFFYLYTSRDAALEDGYNYDDAGTTMNRTLAQGESVWLKTQNLRSYYSYTFSVQKRETPVDPELSLDTPKDVKVAAGESQELTFTVADEGLYTFSSTAGANYRLAPRAAGDSDVLVTLKVNGAVKYSENGSVFEIQVYLQAGDMVSLTMVNNGSTVSALTVTARQTELTVTEVTTDTDVSVENGGLYKFTAGTEGNYEFFLSPLSDDMETYEVHLYGSEADAYNGENAIVDAEVWQNLAEYRMSADETVWISTKLSGTAGGNLTIAKMDQKMTLDTPIAVSVPTGERHRYLTYQVSQDGNYKFATVTGGLSDMEGCVTITVNGEEVFLQNSVAVIDFDFRWVLQQGDTVCIEITSGFGENDMEVTVKAEELTIPDLSEEEITLEKGKRNVAYKYTVTKDGTYQIRMESNLSDMNLLCYDRLSDLFQENMDSAIGSDTGVSSEGENKYSCTTDKLVLTTGQIVYINPRNGNDSADMQATITVSDTQEPSPEPEPEQPTDPTEPEEPENP